jgi:prophage tail gpP-like protein
MSLAPLPEVTVGPGPPETPLTDVKDPEVGGSGYRPVFTDDAVHLVVGSLDITGWERVAVTRGIEIFPSSFDIMLTERYPGQAAQVDVKAGDFCEVLIGSTLILTGFIDRRISSIGPEGNIVRIMGRSKCQDLVDCMIDPDKLPNMQISSDSAFNIAKLLASQYNIPVQMLGTPNNNVIPQLNPPLGTTPFEIIERNARFTAMLAYDETDGSLNLAELGAGAMASGFVEGQNIERATGIMAMDERYSDIAVYQNAVNPLAEAGPMPPLVLVKDDTVPRFRKLIIISEQPQLGVDIAKQRGEWEKARRYGRSQACSLTIDSWRDSAGTLWHINCLAPLDAPHLKLVGLRWLITQVTFRRDEGGTHADIVMMPKEAFQPEPIILLPMDAELYKASPPGGGAAAPSPEASP